MRPRTLDPGAAEPVLAILNMTPEQVKLYHPIWGEFCDFAYKFVESHRVLAFFGTLDVRQDGSVALRDLLVVRSCAHQPQAQEHAVRQLRSAIADAKWLPVSADPDCSQWDQDDFRLILLSGSVDDRVAATHLLLFFGEGNEDGSSYLRHDFPLCLASVDEGSPPSSHFYPVRTDCSPQRAEIVDVIELTRRLQGKQLVALTGAGMSLSSGIPTFRGQGGLEENFPLFGDFPGHPADWMVKRPGDLAGLLGRFQASFLTAHPNAAHFALAGLERQGVLACIITGNKDRLHERAGSHRVRLKDASQFVGATDGWGWISEGQALLVVGISEDEHGLIAYARDQGLQIVAVAPERPSFLCAGDWFVEGRAEDVLPRVTAGFPVVVDLCHHQRVLPAGRGRCPG
jgi:hypothetical protein